MVVWGHSEARSIVMDAECLETGEGVCEDTHLWVVLEFCKGSGNCH
jgi:hypothetical protein